MTLDLEWFSRSICSSGAPLERRAIQLGIRGETLKRFVSEWIMGIEGLGRHWA